MLDELTGRQTRPTGFARQPVGRMRIAFLHVSGPHGRVPMFIPDNHRLGAALGAVACGADSGTGRGTISDAMVCSLSLTVDNPTDEKFQVGS